ncbi:putative transcriptional regulator [Chryseobacterium bernardetii]|jgi:predicted transcriptional regulator|uniref:DNA-binding MarR family transcriptional regulator n=3 Tax=Chryseobacterium TaxID=59732 RepID=A0A543EL64_9FLAO|nr:MULTISPECIES: MarR family transcriptional regulator [Chryseobacterium]MDR6372368.1 putative transcriptional regulator [Chryseobacterium vietnamense]MDR6442248.1 putative transcriptional regulator [Chryseobacterium bernardetii]TQM22325.1 DNA-binding MarR family transcriptional regulator [Chryseobacterium aquifrigidense]
MNYTLIKDFIDLLQEFENEVQMGSDAYPGNIQGFKAWISNKQNPEALHAQEPYWEGKENGRTPESAISTLLVHLNRYAKTYSKSAISDSEFSTQEDFIYLINLKAFGEMTKMALIKKNIHDKPVGMLIIARLLRQGLIEQTDSDQDKRSKVIRITERGLQVLGNQMEKIRQATNIVAGNLNYYEKMELIRILNKLDRFHYPIFSRNISSDQLIDIVYDDYSFKDSSI